MKIEAQRHVIPQCAMRVKRTQEMGAATPFAPPGACGCYYEKVATGTHQLHALRDRRGLPGERARLQLRLLRAAVSRGAHLSSRKVR